MSGLRFWFGAVLVLVLVGPTRAQTPLFALGDTIRGGHSDGTDFSIGVAGFEPDENNWPDNESPERAIDGVGQKHLNFAKENSGVLVTPALGSTVATSLKLWTANDAIPRDPARYELLGTNADVSGPGPLELSLFTAIAAGPLALPDSRNSGADTPLLDSNSQTVAFANAAAFTSYLVLFPEVKDSASSNSVQIAEVQLFGQVIPEPASAMLLGLGGLALFGVRARRRAGHR